MNLEDKKKIYNLLLGYCYILNEKEDCYLIYAENKLYFFTNLKN